MSIQSSQSEIEQIRSIISQNKGNDEQMEAAIYDYVKTNMSEAVGYVWGKACGDVSEGIDIKDSDMVKVLRLALEDLGV